MHILRKQNRNFKLAATVDGIYTLSTIPLCEIWALQSVRIFHTLAYTPLQTRTKEPSKYPYGEHNLIYCIMHITYICNSINNYASVRMRKRGIR